MKIFEESIPLDGRWDSRVSAFEYLERSSREEANEARSMLEGWFANYPTANQGELRSRIRSKRVVDHDAAVFELLLHELFFRSKCKDIEIEPELPSATTRPDFRMRLAKDQLGYVEATVATGMSDKQRGQQRNADQLIEAIRTARSPDFHIDVTLLGPVVSLDGVKSIPKKIEEFLGRLDYDEVSEGFQHWVDGPHGPPKKFHAEFSRKGFKFSAIAIPRGKDRGKNSPALGVWSSHPTAQYSRTKEWIRDAVTEKASKYGELERPYIIAINVLDWTLRAETVIEAVLGTEQVRWQLDGDGKIADTSLIYGRDGAFGTPDNPRRTNVSAVLCFNQVSPWSAKNRRAMLVHNPWAERPIEGIGVDVQDITFSSSGTPEKKGEGMLDQLLVS